MTYDFGARRANRPPTPPRSASNHPLNETFTFNKKPSRGLPPVDHSDPNAIWDGREVNKRVELAVSKVADRSLEGMLMHMRTKDRDRDRVLRPQVLEDVLEKYKVPLAEVIDFLHNKFEDKTYARQTNYEDLMQYLMQAKDKSNRRQKDEDEQQRLSNENNFKIQQRKDQTRQRSAQRQRSASTNGR